MTAALIIEGVLLAVAVVFVIALLRSHAEILRRLGALERDRGGGGAGGDAGGGGRGPAGAASAAASPGGAEAAPDIVGRTLSGDTVKLAVGAGVGAGAGASAGPTLLAFLSSGCAACGPLWSALADGARAPGRARLVIVTHGPERESLARLQELAPDGHELVMSTGAWADYGVPATPHFVLVDGQGTIEGRGSASSWEQLVALLEQSRADAAAGARTSAERAARADQALARAGITPGHPSLYPSRAGKRR